MPTISSTTAIATNWVKPYNHGQSRKSSACASAEAAQIRLVPTWSASRPSGTAKANDDTPAIVRPRPTWAAVRPTIWVKKTALPVRKVPLPIAKRMDWKESRRARADGGRNLSIQVGTDRILPSPR